MTALHASGGGGVKYAWRKVSSLIAFSLAVYKFSSLGGFTCWVINPTYGFHSHSERSEESRELHAHQTQKTLLNITPSQPSPSREGVKTSSAPDGEVSRRDEGEIYKEVLC